MVNKNKIYDLGEFFNCLKKATKKIQLLDKSATTWNPTTEVACLKFYFKSYAKIKKSKVNREAKKKILEAVPLSIMALMTHNLMQPLNNNKFYTTTCNIKKEKSSKIRWNGHQLLH